MIFFYYLFLIFLIISCDKRNVTMESNWSENNTYTKDYKTQNPRTPLQNIPYIISYVSENENYKNKDLKEKMTEYAENSYYSYQSDVDEMRSVMKKVTDRLKNQTINQAQDVKYVFSKEAGEYVLDPDSVSESVEIPTLDDRYNVNERMQYKTSIPSKNAYTILQMQYQGYVPNEEYFNNLMVANQDNIQTYEFTGTGYDKTDKEIIELTAGERISVFANKVYDKIKSKDKNK